MPTDKRSAEFELLARLRRSSTLRAMGCQAIRGLTGTICLAIAGKAIGAWWFEAGVYRFAPVAYRTHALETRLAEDAVAKSVELATRQIVVAGDVA